MFSSFKASSEPSSNQFYTDLEPIFQPFWEPKSIIEAAWMAFEDVKLSSWVLSDVINVFNGFWVRGRFELTQNFMKNTFPKRYRTFHAHGTPSGSIFQPSWNHFGTFGVPKWVGRGQDIVIGRTAGYNFESKNDVDPFSDDFWTTFGPFWNHFQSLQRQFLYNFCYLYYARCYLIDTY